MQRLDSGAFGVEIVRGSSGIIDVCCVLFFPGDDDDDDCDVQHDGPRNSLLDHTDGLCSSDSGRTGSSSDLRNSSGSASHRIRASLPDGRHSGNLRK